MTQSDYNDRVITEQLRNFRETSRHPSKKSSVLLLLPSSAEPRVWDRHCAAHGYTGNSLAGLSKPALGQPQNLQKLPCASTQEPVPAWQQVSPACSCQRQPGHWVSPRAERPPLHSPSVTQPGLSLLGSTRGKADVSYFQLNLAELEEQASHSGPGRAQVC